MGSIVNPFSGLFPKSPGEPDDSELRAEEKQEKDLEEEKNKEAMENELKQRRRMGSSSPAQGGQNQTLG